MGITACRIERNIIGMVVAVLLAASPLRAQQSQSGIAGLVRDNSGGVLPGVTVEAASPALIEKVRTAVTDAEGRYNIINLRPGTYSVTFTLPGFTTFKRDGITLSIGFTATVNAEMQVGGLEETVTVTGEAPLVDTQSARQQSIISSTLLQALPTGEANIVTLVALTPGYSGNATVGGSTGQYHGGQTKGMFHGKRGSHINFDGMRIDNYAGAGDSPGYLFNQLTVQETALETGGATAESSAPNVNMNMVPKEGGNTFSYMVESVFSNHNMQFDNMNGDLRARGLTDVPKLNRLYDVGFTMGGPIRKDKVWFFAAIRRWGTKNQAAGLYENATRGTPFYTPDLSRPAFRDDRYASNAVRITWQVSQRNKLNLFTDIKHDCICASGGASSGLGSGATNAQEGVSPWRLWPNGLIQATWTMPVTSRLLLEAGASDVMFHWPNLLYPGTSPDDVAITELSTNFRYNSVGGTYLPDRRVGDRYSQRFAMSYVTGSHAYKTGFQWDQGYSDEIYVGTGLPGAKGVSYRFRNARPDSLQYNAIFHSTYFQKAELGVYAQDQWTVRRLTVNYGLRFDYYNGYIPRLREPARDFTPAVDYAPVHGGPAWKDINPRLGASYDLFGNGRTALKLAFGRYVAMSGNGQVRNYSPLYRSVNQTTRSWNDVNGNYVPDCDLHNFGANGECGPLANQNFGMANPNATIYAKDVTSGWAIRPYTWDVGAELQHQISNALSVSGGYYHNWDGAFAATDNTLVTPADYDPFCVTAPSDPRLPHGGGYEVCGLYDIKPEKFGKVSNTVTQSSHFGRAKRSNDFIDISFQTRFGNGVLFGGGFDTGRTVDDVCFAVDSPGAVASSLPGTTTSPFNPAVPHSATTVDGRKTCHVVTPIAGNTQLKFNGSYPLPAGFAVSATFQNLPGTPILATYNVSSATVQRSLGRPLAGGTRSVAVPLLVPQTIREPRRTQVDFRVSKYLSLGPRRLQTNFDLYNLFNSSAILGENTTYGASWRKPTLLLQGRLMQVSFNLTF